MKGKVDHVIPFPYTGLISALAIDCINLSYFQGWKQTAEGHVAGTLDVFECDVAKGISFNLDNAVYLYTFIFA